MSTPRRAAQRRVWVVRHGSRLDFEDPSWQERAARPHDPPLADAGHREARAVAEALTGEPIEALFSSPFLRCVQTARPIAEGLGLPIRIEPGLSEWLNTEWFPQPPELQGLDELGRAAPAIDPLYQPMGRATYGESGLDALRRSGEVTRRLVDAFAGDLVLVGHGASVLGAIAGLLGIEPGSEAEKALPEPPYGSLAGLVKQGTGWRWALRPTRFA